MFGSKVIAVPTPSPDVKPSIIRKALNVMRKKSRARSLPCERYQYRALQASTSFRLLRIEPGQGDDCIFCTLEEVKADDSSIYSAISYVWGQPIFSKRIYCDNGFIDVTANAFAALRRLRRKDNDVYTWIDAICINQHDRSERSQQVLLMSSIYSQASEVIIWLGENSKPYMKAIDVVPIFNAICDHADMDQGPTKVSGRQYLAEEVSVLLTDATCASLVALFEHDWFHRVWTYQELFSARSAQILCGGLALDCDELTASAVYICYLHYLSKFNSIRASKGLNQLVGIKKYGTRMNVPLFELMKLTQARQASDPRDKIYGLLSLVKDQNPLPYPPTYDIDARTLYRDFAAHAIVQSQELRLLEVCEMNEPSPLGQLPSWVPTWSSTGLLFDSLTSSRDPFCAADPAIERARLEVQGDTLLIPGLVVDGIEAVGTQMFFSGQEREQSYDDFEWTLMGVIYDESRKMIDKSISYGSSEDIKEEVRSHTLVGGRYTDYRRADQDTNSIVKTHEWYQKHRGIVSVEPTDPRCEHIMEAQRRIKPTADDRRLCLSSKGMIGWVPKKGREGDVIAVAVGSEIPLVLRPRGDEEYEVVGACYIHGIMDGEALEEGGSKMEMTILRLI